tara:strand:+ start:276 stop:926 length:651 start_codon:yes stop_codon:yes gene_type:complete
MIEKFDIKRSRQKVDYIKALKFMEKKVNHIITKNHNEMIWFLNHDHIYTCGTSSKKSEILKKNKLKVIKTNRGGKTTYHGPGQRIIYFMINLNKRKKDIRKFVTLIENTTIELLKDYDVEAKTYPGRIGVWVIKYKGKKLTKEKKIAAVGLRIKRWVTYHGLSFNINPNLKYYEYINACGLKNYSATSLFDFDIKLSTKEFDNKFIKIFSRKLKIF